MVLKACSKDEFRSLSGLLGWRSWGGGVQGWKGWWVLKEEGRQDHVKIYLGLEGVSGNQVTRGKQAGRGCGAATACLSGRQGWGGLAQPFRTTASCWCGTGRFQGHFKHEYWHGSPGLSLGPRAKWLHKVLCLKTGGSTCCSCCPREAGSWWLQAWKQGGD